VGGGVLSSTLLAGNRATQHGGALFSAGPASLTAVRLMNNSASDSGGGAYCNDDVNMTASLLDGNTAGNAAGGLFHNTTMKALRVTASNFSRNAAAQLAGALVVNANDTQVADSLLQGNVCSGGFAFAGAVAVMAVHGGDVQFTRVAFSGNRVVGSNAGAGPFTSETANTYASGHGGALYVASRGENGRALAMLLANCTLSGNAAHVGGALSAPGSAAVALTVQGTSFVGARPVGGCRPARAAGIAGRRLPNGAGTARCGGLSAVRGSRRQSGDHRRCDSAGRQLHFRSDWLPLQ